MASELFPEPLGPQKTVMLVAGDVHIDALEIVLSCPADFEELGKAGARFLFPGAAAVAALAGEDDVPPTPRATPCRCATLHTPRLLGRARGDDPSAQLAAFRAEVDEPVGRLDDFEIVLDHQHGVSRLDEPVQDLQQQLDVGEMQSGGRLVEQIEVRPVLFLTSSRASLTRCASPPERVGDGCPSFM